MHDGADHDPCPRILIVDDDPDSAVALAGLFEMSGARTVVAFGAEVGLHQMQVFKPAAAVIDLRMPGLDGCEALLEARRLELVHPATLFVCCTASTDPADEARCRVAGFDLFLHKPIQQDELAMVVAWAAQRMLVIDFMDHPPQTGYELDARMPL
ncbi:response regulator [Aquincola sp. S2]|uniref:Response regulator n=1 Tax=Pseudaquabacterium terrae TaxID=2732868 RepID=A0ABX2EHV4_9BURK|nr:response regulator [Aquabacterium terrae]NRF68196.1 response regulator [Aquabacterium terrae]